jgi:hypothetical protein
VSTESTANLILENNCYDISVIFNFLIAKPERTTPLMSKKMMSIPLAFLFICLAFSVLVSLDFPCTAHTFFLNACLITAKVSVALVPRFERNLMLFLCRIHREIASGQIQVFKDVKIITSTQPRDILNTDSQDMLVVSCTVACHVYNCCTDSSTCPANYGYFLALVRHLPTPT